MVSIQDFTHLSKVSKTLRFRLIPMEKTEEYIKAHKILEKDKKKAEAYQQAKILLDNVYKKIINDNLESYKSNNNIYDPTLYTQLADALEAFQISKTPESRKTLRNAQRSCRENIVKHMKSSSDITVLQGKEVKKILDLAFANLNSSDIQSLSSEFKGFAGYFNGYCENRRNLFTVEERGVAVPHRIINENFSKFHNNVRKFQKLSIKHPEFHASLVEKLVEVAGALPVKSFFSIENFTDFITQKGIDQYNTLLGGLQTDGEDGKIQGINEYINLYCQQHPEIHRRDLLMTPLYKQILSDRTQSAFIPTPYENEEEMLADVKTLISEEFNDLFESSARQISRALAFDTTSIYFSSVQVRAISQYCYHEWNAIQTAHELRLTEDMLNGRRKLTKKEETLLQRKVKKNHYTLKDVYTICESIGMSDGYNSFESFFSKEIDRLLGDLAEARTRLIELFYEQKDNQSLFTGNPHHIEILKTFLDLVLQVVNLVRGILPPSDYDFDTDFYELLLLNNLTLKTIPAVYDKIRNFLTKKSHKEKQFKLNFESPTLGDGWDENKQTQNLCVILRKDGEYYLGILNKNDKPDLQSEDLQITSGEKFYERMVYKYLSTSTRMLPKVFFPKSGNFPVPTPPDLVSCVTKKRDKVEHYYSPEYESLSSFEKDLIRFYQKSIPLYGDWRVFEMEFKSPEEYATLKEFYQDVDSQNYRITFSSISASYIESLVQKGRLYLFKIYNKDFAPGASGKKNLHTMYWNAAFSERNLKDFTIKLNGQAQLFYRPAVNSGTKKPTHPEDSYVVNRTTREGKTLPDEIHAELFRYANTTMKKDSLSIEAKKFYPEAIIKQVAHSITKGKRFLEDQYFFHVSLTFNSRKEVPIETINEKVSTMLKENENIHVMGIDRGEKNLLYISILDHAGTLVHQESLNILERPNNRGFVDYQDKLKKAEFDRDKARKSWRSINKIKDLKEGYLSHSVSRIAHLVVEYQAVIVLEDLNFGFKRGRYKVERQVYQKFESALMNKLHYLVFKDRSAEEPGGVLNAYQLTPPFESFQELKKQKGWIFYIPSAYTSVIDPSTGFVNMFKLKGLTNYEKKLDFFNRFDSIRYDKDEDSFLFTFDYANFDTTVLLKKRKAWEVSSRGQRIVYRKKERDYSDVRPTEMLKAFFDTMNVDYSTGKDLLPEILTMQFTRSFDQLYRAFIYCLQLRNSNARTGEDYILSPVKNSYGLYYDSRTQSVKSNLPCDADANGAYNIARKGMMYVHQLMESENPTLKIAHDAWLSYAMS